MGAVLGAATPRVLRLRALQRFTGIAAIVTFGFAILDQALSGGLRPTPASMIDLATAITVGSIWILSKRPQKDATVHALLAAALLVFVLNTAYFGRTYVTEGQPTSMSPFLIAILLIGVSLGLNATWSLVVAIACALAIVLDPGFQATPDGLLGLLALGAGGAIVFSIRRQLDAALGIALATAAKAHEEALTAQEAALKTRAREDRLEALRTLAAGAAHEYNNPLMFVLTSAEAARAEVAAALASPGLSPEAMRALTRIQEELEVAQRGLHRMARITTGLHQATRTSREPLVELDPTELARAVIDPARLRIPPGVVVREGFRATRRVKGRRGDVGAILLALIENASDALRDAKDGMGTIEFVTRDEGDSVLFEVSDDGPGIDPIHSPRLFAPFFTTRESSGRIGLSLSIALRAARDQGGDVTYSPREGGGATFSLRMPAA